MFFYRRINQEKVAGNLKKEVTELECHENKLKYLSQIISRGLQKIGDGDPPKGLDLPENPVPPEVCVKVKVIFF